MVARVRAADPCPSKAMTDAVARNYHKLLAYKDEYEVARLYTNGDFMKNLKAQFGGNFKLNFHMAPPIMETPDPATGRPKKRTFGPWMLGALGMLAKFKFLRGTPMDVFGYHPDRKQERALIVSYESDIKTVLANVGQENYDTCVEILNLPDMIRGFGPVKEGNIQSARIRHTELMAKLAGGQPVKKAA
jgi:indolepyruvate ferredoxin oxidoreductase